MKLNDFACFDGMCSNDPPRQEAKLFRLRFKGFSATFFVALTFLFIGIAHSQTGELVVLRLP